MGDMLSQAEIDALLNSSTFSDNLNEDGGYSLNSQEMDALGEIGNINMGTSATTLSTLLGKKVLITTPLVTITAWEELTSEFTAPFAAVKIEYTHGLEGSNLLILKEMDVKIITDLMMGGDGTNTQGDLNELHMSAIAEAMNQMIGSSATSMSEMLKKRVDISPPEASIIGVNRGNPDDSLLDESVVVKIAFKMVIGDLVDSEIMQVLPYSFAKKLVNNLLNLGSQGMLEPDSHQPARNSHPAATEAKPKNTSNTGLNNAANGGYGTQASGHTSSRNQENPERPAFEKPQINVQPAYFEPFEDSSVINERKNIHLIMDVPLQVTVELGRTNKPIRDILEFGPGSIIELEKIAGEPVDILVNGKNIAKGEVVVIDESFGVRITDIINPAKRL